MSTNNVVIKVINGQIESIYADGDVVVEVFDLDTQNIDENGVPEAVVLENEWNEAISQDDMHAVW